MAEFQQLCAMVSRAAELGQTVRPVGKGHSFTPLVRTDGILVSLHELTGVDRYDADRGEAVVWAGTTVEQLGADLHQLGLAVHNLGDVNYQAIAGAVGTATHGTGSTLGNLATPVLGVRMVTATGEVVEADVEKDPDLLRALRVSLGSFGIFTQLRLRVGPAFDLHRRSWCAHVEHVLDHLDELVQHNRVFDFYWYPRSEEAQIRTLNEPGREPDLTVPVDRLYEDDTGPMHDMLPKDQELRYEEMEYLMPAEAGPDCFRAVRSRILSRHRHDVGWRVLYRTIAGDDAYLSTAYGRDSVSIALLQNATLPYREYFDDLEPIFREFGGRPHWGKHHNLRAAQLRPLYPEWDRFQELRRATDPDGVFLNGYLRDLFGAEPSAAGDREGRVLR